MTAPIVSQADLCHVHAAMGITVPLDQVSPLLLTTLMAVARAWKKRPPRQAVDLKRRAAGDNDYFLPEENYHAAD
ncbi:hypothetical protein ACVBEF_01265 [Glaciimonas sp. GG7]